MSPPNSIISLPKRFHVYRERAVRPGKAATSALYTNEMGEEEERRENVFKAAAH